MVSMHLDSSIAFASLPAYAPAHLFLALWSVCLPMPCLSVLRVFSAVLLALTLAFALSAQEPGRDLYALR